MTVDGNGDVLVSGACQSKVDFGDGTRISGGPEFDPFVAKYSGVDGEYIWAKRFGDLDNGYGYGVAVDAQGDVYVTGLAYSPHRWGYASRMTPLKNLPEGGPIFLILRFL